MVGTDVMLQSGDVERGRGEDISSEDEKRHKKKDKRDNRDR